MYSFLICFYNNSDIFFLSECVGNDKAKGTGMDQGTCDADEFCTAAGECLGT